MTELQLQEATEIKKKLDTARQHKANIENYLLFKNSKGSSYIESWQHSTGNNYMIELFSDIAPIPFEDYIKLYQMKLDLYIADLENKLYLI